MSESNFGFVFIIHIADKITCYLPSISYVGPFDYERIDEGYLHLPSDTEKEERDFSGASEGLFTYNMTSERHSLPVTYYPCDISQNDPANQCDKDGNPNYVGPNNDEVDKVNFPPDTEGQ